MLEHEHYNPSNDSYWQLRIGFGIRYWWQDIWPAGYGPKRVLDKQGKPIERGTLERVREREA